MLHDLRPSHRFYLKNRWGIGKHEGGVSVSVHRSANKEKAGLMGKDYKIVEARMTLNHQKFP